MPEPAPDPTEVLAAIEKPRSIAHAEERLTLLRNIRDDLSDMAQTLRLSSSQGLLTPTPEQQEISVAQRENADQIAAARRKLEKLASDHRARLRSSLADRRAAALTGLQEAWNAMLDHWTELDGLDQALRQAGGSNTAKRRASATQAELLFGKLVRNRLLAE